MTVDMSKDSPQAWVEAFTIFANYAEKDGTYLPVHAEHDTLSVCVAPEKVSEEHKARLGELGWEPAGDLSFLRYTSA